jgi:signal transduction histidine kinase
MNKIGKTRRLYLIYFLFWLMLAYIIAALIWWFIELYQQNEVMIALKKEILLTAGGGISKTVEDIENERSRKVFQYLGEGITFLLLIIAVAVLFLRAIRKQLQISQQQQSFMMAVTHELKTPIAVSGLNLETLQKRKLDPAQEEKLIRNTLEELGRMNSLCNNMLLSSQFDTGKFKLHNEKIHLYSLAENCTGNFRNRQHVGKLILSGSDMTINGDLALLEIMINNLIDNAIKYSPKQESIEIRIGRDTATGMAFVRIEDKGAGIPENEREKIFDKFYRIGNEATKAAKGTGLGLYLVKRICSAHEGKINVTGNQPRGTIIEVLIPAIT